MLNKTRLNQHLHYAILIKNKVMLKQEISYSSQSFRVAENNKRYKEQKEESLKCTNKKLVK